MPRAPFAIGGRLIAPGTRETVDLPVSVLYDHTPVTMSAHVIHGRRAGPTVAVTAGIHGDEIIGVEILRRLLTQPSLTRLRGTLIVVPVVNTYGFLARSRYLPDRRDLNRCFPGHPSGSLASRLAHLLMTEVIARADLGIDLHSAAVHRTNLPQIRISQNRPHMLRLARAFGAPVVIRSPLRDGSLRQEAAKAGVDVLLYEAGEGLRFDEHSARVGVTGILRVLHDQGMIAGKGLGRRGPDPILSQSSRWLRAPHGGLVRMYRSEGDVVAQGDLLATVADPFGEIEAEVTAPSDGVLIGRATLPVVNEGDALYHLALVDPDADPEATMEELATEIDASPLFDEDEII